MLTASWSSWAPGREGGALRGVIDDITDKGTHRSGERLIERYSWTEPGWVLTKAGVDAINSGACDEPDPDV
jgi:hypothetical protein